MRNTAGRGARAALAVVGVALMAAGGLAAGPSAVAAQVDVAAPRTGLVAEYLFTQASGSSVPNSATGAAAGAATVVNGTDAQWTGSSLVLAGGARTTATANWVRLPGSLLQNAQSATVTVETRFDASMLSSFHFLWNTGSSSTNQYWFASVRDLVRTAITTTGGGGEVNARSGSRLVADRWYSVTSVIDGQAGTISLWVDGVQVASAPTALRPAAIVDQSVNTIGRAPYNDPNYRGEVSAFRVYDRALTAAEIADVSRADAAPHTAGFRADAERLLAGLQPLTLTDPVRRLPEEGGALRWSSSDPALRIDGDGRTLRVTQPPTGDEPTTGALTATATVRGVTATRSIPVTVRPLAGAEDPYGYLMVHFVEDSAGYAEKIFLDISRGDDPEQWDPLNGREPILASQLGTTGVRDPYLVRNPETGRYFIIATDLRVFGGDAGSGSCTTWCHWTRDGRTVLHVWESDDLVTWSEPRQFDVTLDERQRKQVEIGMAWAPEATWVDDLDGSGDGGFVVYWASTVYPGPARDGSPYSSILWGSTTDFTQETYSYGGVFIDDGGDVIDTTIAEEGGTTYRVTKDNAQGKGLYLESTTAARWWEPGAVWTRIQQRIGADWSGGAAGGVEGPAMFRNHADGRWYLYVDVIPTVGYRPMVTDDLDRGFVRLTDPSFFLTPHTKHGGVVSLTRGEYDRLRAADATGAVQSDLGDVEVAEGADAATVRAALPPTAEVARADGLGTAQQPVDWDVSSVGAAPGAYRVTGTVRTIGANRNDWVGANGATAWNAPDRVLRSTTAITVQADVTVVARAVAVTATAATRCVAGRPVVTSTLRSAAAEPVRVTVASQYGSRTIELAPGRSASVAFRARTAAIPAGTVTATPDGGAAVRAEYRAVACP